MSRIGVVWHSSTGYTTLLADAVARGAGAIEGASVIRAEVTGEDISSGRYENDLLLASLDDCDAIILGCPTYMGSVSAQMKSFMDACLSRWYEKVWAGKIAAAFTVSATPSGDKLNALMDLFVFSAQMGMIWVGLDELPMGESGANRLGVYIGAAAQPDYQATEPSLMDRDVLGGERLGQRVAELAGQLN